MRYRYTTACHTVSVCELMFYLLSYLHWLLFSFGQWMSVQTRWRLMASTSRVSCWSYDDHASTRRCQASRVKPLPHRLLCPVC